MTNHDSIKESKQYALECKNHYHEVLKMAENDTETHYQLSLLYLTMLETTLIQSIDNIHSPLTVASIQYLSPLICSGAKNLNETKRTSAEQKINFSDYPIGRGIYSPWYDDRIEIHHLCRRHLQLTMDGASEMDPVLFGSYITFARLSYIECIPPFSFSLCSKEEKLQKLTDGMQKLEYALQINDKDATLHHDLGLLLSHEAIGKYADAIYHWQISYQLDDKNPIYCAQIAYIYQYYLNDHANAIKYYNLCLNIKPNMSQIWNNLGILSAQSAKTQNDIIYATQCWTKCLMLSPNHCEAHRNLGNIRWLHYSDTHKGEIHLQRAIAISTRVYTKISEKIQNYKANLHKLLQQKRSLYERHKMILSKIKSFKFSDGAKKNVSKCEEVSDEIMDEENENFLIDLVQQILYNEALKDKFCKFLAQSKSDYGGLLLMMFKYDIEAEKELKNALKYDEKCISAHYYLGKHLFDTNKDYKESQKHLLKYIELETNKNVSNRAHSHQILGQLNMRNEQYKNAHFHFGEAIKLSSVNANGRDSKNKNNAALPVWAQCQIHVGFADSIIEFELSKLYDENGNISSKKSQEIIQKLQSKQWNDDENKSNFNEIEQLSHNIEVAKKHYRLVLKKDSKFVAAPLGLARIFGKIEGKSKLCDKHYSESIKICKTKLIKLYEKYLIAMEQQIKDEKEENMQKEAMKAQNEKISNLHQNRIAKHSNSINLNIESNEKEKENVSVIEVEEEIKMRASNDSIHSNAVSPEEKELGENEENDENIEDEKTKKVKFSDRFKITLSEIDEILGKQSNFNISVIRIAKELRQYVMYCIDAHLGKIDLIIQSLHNNKWKEALSHCVRVLYLDENNIGAYCNMALLHFKREKTEKAMLCAKYAMKLAKEYDQKNGDKKTKKQNIVKNNLYMILKFDKQSKSLKGHTAS